MSTGPDILHFEALLVPNLPKERALKEALTFGFARGIERERLLSVTEPPVALSSFDQEVFSRDLFLGELVERSFRIAIQGKNLDAKSAYFLKLIMHPPRDRRSAELRVAIQRELSAHVERKGWLENAYLSLIELRDSLCDAAYNQRSVGVRRRIEILMAYKKSMDSLFRATSTSTSGLARIAAWIEGVAAQAAHQTLVQLLDFEGGRSVLETRLQAGYDGTLRRFEIVRVTQVEHGAFPRGVVSRFIRSLVSLVKGYRFSEEDVMSQVLDDVFGKLEDEIAILLGLLQQIEFYLRASFFATKAAVHDLATCHAQWVNRGVERKIQGLFNPWLMAKKSEKPVPCEVSIKSQQAIFIVTGPNSGGKTRLLQSLAITQLLAQSGLPLPAHTAQLSWVEQLYLSMIEHVDADQAEGRLGLELMRIRQVFETSGENSLILMDELCSGTNPSEGERIFEMVLELLLELGANVWITTHFLDFALRILEKHQAPKALGTPSEPLVASGDEKGTVLEPVAFFQVELDGDNRPTYQFIPGVAQTSLARNTAARLGVTHDELRSLILKHSDRARLI